MEEIYDEMHIRNTPHTNNDIKYDTNLNHSAIRPDTCFAIYSMGNWYLEESWIRLQNWLKDILGEYSILYSVNPTHLGGKLHQTMLQYISFGYDSKSDFEQSHTICKEILDKSAFYTTIYFKGLVFTKSGIAMRGFSRIPDHYEKIMNIRNNIEAQLRSNNAHYNIPYKNDILHSTILRWKSKPTDAVLTKLKSKINEWKECVFGEIRINEWSVGKATWTMLDNDRTDIFNIKCNNQILHRGLSISDKTLENHLDTLEKRHNIGYSCEYDIWFHNHKWWTGHDNPTYIIDDIDKLLKASLNDLIHAKDGITFAEIIKYCRERGYNNEIFYHTDEDYVLTTRSNIIVYPGKFLVNNSICMMPENIKRDLSNIEKDNITSICSDLIDIHS